MRRGRPGIQRQAHLGGGAEVVARQGSRGIQGRGGGGVAGRCVRVVCGCGRGQCVQGSGVRGRVGRGRRRGGQGDEIEGRRGGCGQ